MNKKVFWLSIIGIFLSFAGGFLLANALNRKEMESLRAEVGRLKAAPQTAAENESAQPLTDEEIRGKIAEADRNPEKTEFQKNLAMALYRYANVKQETKWLDDIARLLTRVYEKNPKDFNTIVSLGNVYFDVSQIGSAGENKADSEQNLVKARQLYQKGLEIKPNDTNVRTDLGITFLMSNPAENKKAIAEFQRVLRDDANDERALIGIVKAYTNLGKTKEAEEYLNKLKQINSGNEDLPELEAKIAEKKNKQ